MIKKKAKTIKEYSEILSKIRNEYALLQKEYNQTKIELQKYQHYIQNLPLKPRMNYQKPIEKENIITMMIKKKAKKVIPMLLKFEEDVQTDIEKR